VKWAIKTQRLFRWHGAAHWCAMLWSSSRMNVSLLSDRLRRWRLPAGHSGLDVGDRSGDAWDGWMPMCTFSGAAVVKWSRVTGGDG